MSYAGFPEPQEKVRKPMNFVKKSVFACMLAIVMTTLLTASVASAAGTWSIVRSPNVGALFNNLNGVAVVSANDIWTVGSYSNGRGGPYQTLTEHWNGTSWKAIPSPNVAGSKNDELLGVAAVSATDIWAVGNYDDSNYIKQTLIENWNGTSWQIVPSPSPASNFNQLNGVTAVTANDIWAVGSAFGQTLIENWNGTSWKTVASPNVGSGDQLFGVTAVTATDVWAVGFNEITTTPPDHTLVEHWNGTSWKIVSSPSPGPSINSLHSVAAVSATNIWAVGDHDLSNHPEQTLIEHWNGTGWKVVSSPSPGGNYNALVGVVAVSANDIWAVGISDNSTLIEHWNGTSWRVIPSPSPGTNGNSLNGVAVVTATDIWAVGSYIKSNRNVKTLIEHLN